MPGRDGGWHGVYKGEALAGQIVMEVEYMKSGAYKLLTHCATSSAAQLASHEIGGCSSVPRWALRKL